MTVGASWPWRRDETGFPALSSEGDTPRDKIRAYLHGRRGGRPYRPTEGVDALRHTFRNRTPLMMAQIEQQIAAGLANDVPTVAVVDVTVAPGRGNNETVVTIAYLQGGEIETVEVEV